MNYSFTKCYLGKVLCTSTIEINSSLLIFLLHSDYDKPLTLSSFCFDTTKQNQKHAHTSFDQTVAVTDNTKAKSSVMQCN